MKNFRLQLGLLGLLLCLSTQATFSQNAKKNDGKITPQAAAPITQKYSLFFDVGQAKIKSEGYKALDSLVSLLQTNPNVRRMPILLVVLKPTWNCLTAEPIRFLITLPAQG